jgi:hypothetical protein
MSIEQRLFRTPDSHLGGEKPRQEISQRLWLANEAGLKFVVKEIKIIGRENIKEIPPGAKVVIMTTHLTDLDISVAIHAVAREMDVAVTNQSTHHQFFGQQGEMPTNIGIRIAGKDNFIPIDYHKDEKGDKAPKAFNPENFESAAEAMEKGKSVIVAAHNPSKEPLQNLDEVRGGYGGVYLAELTDAYILPLTVTMDKAVGMNNNILKTIKERPTASAVIGKPFKLEKIEGIEHFSELAKKREDGEKLTEEEHLEFSRLADALRERSALVIKIMSEQLPVHA